jgi:hypothetical protein
MKTRRTRNLAATMLAAALVFGGASAASAAAQSTSATSTDGGALAVASVRTDGQGGITIRDLKCDSRGATVHYQVNGSWRSAGNGNGCNTDRTVAVPRINPGTQFRMYVCTSYGSTMYSCSSTKTLTF